MCRFGCVFLPLRAATNLKLPTAFRCETFTYNGAAKR